MPRPKPIHCGGLNEPACEPEPAIVIEGVEYWTREQVQGVRDDNYHKGRADETAEAVKAYQRSQGQQ